MGRFESPRFAENTRDDARDDPRHGQTRRRRPPRTTARLHPPRPLRLGGAPPRRRHVPRPAPRRGRRHGDGHRRAVGDIPRGRQEALRRRVGGWRRRRAKQPRRRRGSSPSTSLVPGARREGPSRRDGPRRGQARPRDRPAVLPRVGSLRSGLRSGARGAAAADSSCSDDAIGAFWHCDVCDVGLCGGVGWGGGGGGGGGEVGGSIPGGVEGASSRRGGSRPCAHAHSLGPGWLGPLGDVDFLRRMARLAEKSTQLARIGERRSRPARRAARARTRTRRACTRGR